MTPRYLPLLLAALFSAGAARADDIFQRVLVDGSRLNQLGVADSANAGSVTQQQLDARTSYRPGELLEAVPGLIASQHSGEGKANQFDIKLSAKDGSHCPSRQDRTIPMRTSTRTLARGHQHSAASRSSTSLPPA